MSLFLNATNLTSTRERGLLWKRGLFCRVKELGYGISSSYRGDISPHWLGSRPVRYDGNYVVAVFIGDGADNNIVPRIYTKSISNSLSLGSCLHEPKRFISCFVGTRTRAADISLHWLGSRPVRYDGNYVVEAKPWFVSPRTKKFHLLFRGDTNQGSSSAQGLFDMTGIMLLRLSLGSCLHEPKSFIFWSLAKKLGSDLSFQ